MEYRESKLKIISDLKNEINFRKWNFLPQDQYSIEQLNEIEEQLNSTKIDFYEIIDVVKDADDDYDLGGYRITCIKPYGIYERESKYSKGAEDMRKLMMMNDSIFLVYIGLSIKGKYDSIDPRILNTNRIHAISQICKKLESKGSKIEMVVYNQNIADFDGFRFDNYLGLLIYTK